MNKIRNLIRHFSHRFPLDIEKNYSSITSTIDESVSKREINNKIKKLLGAKRICLVLWFIYNIFIFAKVININIETYENISVILYILYTLKAFVVIAHCVVFLLFAYLTFAKFENMYLKRDEGLENYLRNAQPRLKNFCEKCSVTKCIRSFHCEQCEKCILRFEFHSRWFERCMGSQNLYPYSLFLKSMLFYFIIYLVNIALAIILNHKFIFLYILFMLNLYLSIKFYLFSRKVFWNINKNITGFERTAWRRLPYMWKSDSKDFFNPFDKGLTRNKDEIYISYRNTVIDNAVKDKDNAVKDQTNDNVTKTEANLPEVSVLDQSSGNIATEDSSLEVKTINKGDRFKIGKLLNFYFRTVLC
jgi:hypothetical protein